MTKREYSNYFWKNSEYLGLFEVRYSNRLQFESKMDKGKNCFPYSTKHGQADLVGWKNFFDILRA